MKKIWTTMMVALLLAALAVTGMAQGAVKVSGISDMGIYHQLVALIVEYDQEVADPGMDTYTVMDFAAASMKEDYDRRDYAQGVVTAVYTNDVPQQREDKASVPGKYVVIELETCNGSYFDEEQGIQKPNHIAGLCTWRHDGEKSEWFRDDYSELIIAQKKSVVNTEGKVVAAAGLLPTLQAKDIRHLKLERFEQLTLKSEKGNDIHYSLSLPENYDASKKYPMIVSVSGTGGRLYYKQQDEEGNLLCIGGNIGRDSAAAAWLETDEELIIVSPQPWRDEPAEWGVDIVADTIYLLDYLMENYAVDRERVYAIGSSFGTGHLSAVITARPEIFAAYAQCNGGFAKKDTDTTPPNRLEIYNAEHAGSVSGWSCTDALSLPLKADCFKDKEEYWQDAKDAMQGLVDHRMPVYIWQGVNDQGGAWTTGLSTYYLLRDLYEEAGLTQDEIEKLVLLHFAEDQEYFDKGICEIHATSKLAVSYPWFLEWMLAQ